MFSVSPRLAFRVLVTLPFSVVRPFRKVNEKGVLLWDKIHKLQKGQIYKQVSAPSPAPFGCLALCLHAQGRLYRACSGAWHSPSLDRLLIIKT